MRLDRALPLVRVELERSGPAAISDAPIRVDEIEPLRERVATGSDVVRHLVEEDRHLELHVEHAGARHRGALLVGPGLRVEDLVLEVREHLPAVRRMRLLDVDAEELDAVAEAARDLVQAARPNAEGRSGVGAEDERDWATSQPGKRHARRERTTIGAEAPEREVRRE